MTLVVSKHGAKVRSTMHMQTGTYVRVTNTSTNRSQLARVAWVGRKDDTLARLAFGIELLDPENFWGVYVPPADWQEATSWDEDEGEAVQEPHSSDFSTTASAPGGVGNTPQPGAVELDARLPAIEVPEEGADVFVRGISSSRLPFQEHTVLHPVAENEATVRVRPVVDVGRLVQVVFPLADYVARARVSGLGQRRVEGKWKMWIQFKQALRVVKEQET